MGRIKKAAGPKHEATVSPAIAEFVATGSTLPISRLPAHIETFPRRWPFPRGDVYHWIPLLNRFDNILEQFTAEYGLQEGPQTRPFGRALIEKGVAQENKAATIESTSQEELDALGFKHDADRQLVGVILVFSRVLLENCGNRSLYNSSDRLGELLNTTDLLLLSDALQLAVRLAQRYHASRQRGASASQHLNTALLASHYNIDLEKVQKLAAPFTRFLAPSTTSSTISGTTPLSKGKEKAPNAQAKPVPSSDLFAIARDDAVYTNGSAHKDSSPEPQSDKKHDWEDWGRVFLRYYQPPPAPKDEKAPPTTPFSQPPNTPTPAPRRPSGLSRQTRTSSFDESSDSATLTSVIKPEETTVGGMKSLDIPSSRIMSSQTEDILSTTLAEIPKASQYDFLTKVRVAQAMTESSATRQRILGIRLLAITNLAYIYPESTFQQKILQQDSDEPRRLQLAYQLADLIHAHDNEQYGIFAWLPTVSLGTMEALSKHKAKAPDVCAALNVNVSHGVLMHLLRKSVSDMADDEPMHDSDGSNEWREALFSLLDALPTSAPRTGDSMIAAGLLEILVDILNLRTSKAERSFPKILTFLNTTIYTVRDAFQTLANLKGLDAISDLIAHEVQSGLKNAHDGSGLAANFRTQVIDYQVPYFQQQTLRWLFKFVNHMMSHGSGNFDRLLRNLIDSPQLLGGLRTVITNAGVFGSNVWSGAVNIMSSFIHNEPTSFAVIAEAGLSRGLLEAITSRTFPERKQPTTTTESATSEATAETGEESGSAPASQDVLRTDVETFLANAENHADFDADFWEKDINERLTPANFQSMLTRRRETVLAKGILPATDAIVTIPQAFGAICLNNAGMDLFVRSNALTTFFEIFESPDHVKSMDNESELARLLGSSFDELVRHHPRLKDLVMLSVLSMVIRVGYLCNPKHPDITHGARLSTEAEKPEATESHADVVMEEANGAPTIAMGADSNAAMEEDDPKGPPKVASYINVAMKFLSGFFENSASCGTFAELGGLEFLLDFATSESLRYDFSMSSASQEIAKVVHMIAEQKPHLVLPSLVQRTQHEVDALQIVSDHDDGSAFFAKFTTAGQEMETKDYELGTKVVKSFTSVHSLCNILYETFSGPVYNSRSSHTVFNQVNLADEYVVLVKSLSRLHRACVWEEILLQKNMPEAWKDATRIKGYGMGSEEADEVFGFIHHDDQPTEHSEDAVNSSESPSSNASGGHSSKSAKKPTLAESEQSAQFQNVKTLRHLLSQIPSSIVPFFQGLGKALVAKRRPDAYARQNAYMVARAMAESIVEQIKFEAPRNVTCAKDRYAYWIVILTSISQLMIEPPLERNHPQCLTLVLQEFRACGGLKAIEEVLGVFSEEAKSFSSDGSNSKDPVDGPARLTSAYGGIKIILNFYSQVVATKPIVESSQTAAIASNDRDRGHPYFFSPSQFLVDLRMAILPVVRSMWASEFVDKASASIIKCIIGILRTILDGGEEQGALRKGEKSPTRMRMPWKKYNIHADKVGTLTAKGYGIEKVREALYRCMNVVSAAEEYCRSQKGFSRVLGHPIPSYDQETPASTTPVQTPIRRSSEATVPDTSSVAQSEEDIDIPDLPSDEQLLPLVNALEETQAANGGNTPTRSAEPAPASGQTTESDSAAGDPMAISIDNLPNLTVRSPREASGSRRSSSIQRRLGDRAANLFSLKLIEPVTINELDDERTAVRKNLIDRALNLLIVHDEVTFELSDLITSAATKAEDATAMRRETGETLIQSLISFQMADDFRPSGKQVAACANLLALILQDQAFYEATLDELKENFSYLLGFIRMFPDQPVDEPSPWIGQVLLVLEKVLAEDVQPAQIQWTAPNLDDSNAEPAVATIPDPLLDLEDKRQLFTAIVEILPRIGKDESLALSVVRTLVILTRNRSIASQLGEKSNIQRLFVMIKQLAGITNERLQSSFMLLLRHIVEDDDTIRQIMRSEILANFETRRTGITDTTGYVRQMYHLALRAPEIFIEITNEKVEVVNYDASHQPQNLALKSEVPAVEPLKTIQSLEEETGHETVGSKDDATNEIVQPSKEEPSTANDQKPKASDTKAPVVQHPSGVIHYLLCELLTYKEVVDKDHISAAKPSSVQDTLRDVEMEDGVTPTVAIPPQLAESTNSKKDKPEFKPEQHPIYIYRCFLLQCLTELLRCYNRTKIEFINFSRRADGKATTPSKPRSSVLNYLLNDLIPVGTLNHDETILFRKRSSTSNWAMSTVVSLCLRTDESGHPKKRGSLEEEDDTDLQFVRRFVLEHALKAYKDANTSEEALDVKYARLLCLSDLFQRLITGKVVQNASSQSPELSIGPQKLIAKIMYGKEFISALTSSLADIDLNFPGSKRAVKYILRPLKQLTQTAIIVSETSEDSAASGQTDDDDISTATSVSEMDDEREETPDLFRNTTLGMFEPGREEESSSDSSNDDEDMYDDEYDEGMEYEEEMERDGDEVVSDEDEEIEGVGPMEGMPGDAGMNVEVVINGEDDEMEEDSDDDEGDSEDELDEDEEVEVMDEITGDDENDSLADGDDEAWQDEDEAERYDEGNGLDGDFGPSQDPENALREMARDFADAPAALRDIAIEMEGDLTEEAGQDDEAAEEDDEEEGEDEDVIYQPEYDDDESGMPDPPWGWEEGDDQVSAMPRRHHHHHTHRMPTFSQIFPNIAGGALDRLPTYRPNRVSGGPRAADDGVNPLLQRHDRATGGSRSIHTGLSDVAANLSDYWVHGMEPIQPRGLMDSPVSLISNIIGAIGQGGPGGFAVGGPGGALHFTVGSTRGGLPQEVQAMLGLRQSTREVGRSSRDDSLQPTTFLPASTPQRWQEEARLLYGNAHAEKAIRVVNSILRLLVPPAMEKERKQREDEAKAIRLARETAEKRVEEERIAKEAAEKEAREKREKEEAESAAEAEAAAQSQAQEAQTQPEGQDEEAMEGVEATDTEQPTGTSEVNENIMTMEEAAEAGPSGPAERVVTTIRGRELDITGMGIDLEYLDALPEELREEVLMSQVALQRSEAAAAGQEPTDISREFLEALPPDIREELLQQEAQDRRRREREENRRRAAETGTGPPAAARAEEMDTASFLASLDPNLRQAVLMEQDDDMLAQLPPGIAAEARALGSERFTHRFGDLQRLNRMRGIDRPARIPPPDTQKTQRRQIRQMLNKGGVPTLLRLMFVQQQGSSRQTLNGILHDISQNKQNRAEVISLLLSILQDGTADVNAVERSFTSLSLRAKQPTEPKTPQGPKRSLTNQISPLNNSEMTPLMVVQQCLAALVSLTQYNASIPYFFLTEHEVSSSAKSKSSRKGKAKETKASKFALNALLSLLDRKLIMESSSCMEQLSSLLQSVTHPLTILLRKEKEKPEEADKPTDALSNNENQGDTTSAVDTTNTTQGAMADTSAAEATAMTAVQVDRQIPSSALENPPTTAGAENGDAKPSEGDKAAEEKAKKPRTLSPPVVPEENLRLVVNIIAARECSGKTFRDTLSTINNLSAIPEAKEVFGKALIEQAKELGQSILHDLNDLVPQIQQADSGSDIQGMALANFSPASSDQAKLLRVLTALDYLFDPKRNDGKTQPAVGENKTSEEASTSKDDMLTTLYEHPTFGSLWAKLSECLSAIRQGDGTLSIATILLPLIEALMVVCKNTTIKDAPLIKAAKEFSVTSPPPESRIETLFFRFTEDHRKILNDLVRHNPKLMSANFSLLVKNPKVLEFDNKRSYFTRRLHSRGNEARHPQPPLQLNVRRDQVFLDSFAALSFKSGEEIKYGKLSIRFSGEEGVDAGGVTREWFQVLSRQMFNPDYALFIPVASDRTTFHPNKLSKINDEHLRFFMFIGRMIGKALYEGRALDCHFSRAVYKRILGKTVSIKDMETLDLDYYKSLLWMLENDITEIITETFSVETDDFGVTEVVDLIPNGRNIAVTEDNKHEYVQLVVEYRLTGSVKEQLEQFLKGFHDIVPAELIAIFNEQELELLISGLPDIDVDDWKNNTEYHNYSASSSQIQWFWRAVRSFDKEERAKLLQFVTGTSKVPLNGFSQLEGMNGFSRFNIHRDYGNKDRLPSSHTCFNQLDLPEYDSYEALRHQLYTAMTAGSEYFGFA